MKIIYEWYSISINVIMLIGIVHFFRLSKSERGNIFYWLPLLILVFTVAHENVGAFTLDSEFNRSVNAFFGNTENPKYNLWLKNITFYYLGIILYLALIRLWIIPSRKKILTAFIVSFTLIAPIIWLLEFEPFYLNQSVAYAIGANLILIGCGLYFIGLITDDKYLNSEPIRLLSFWKVTFILFNYSLTYINSVSLAYVYSINEDMADSLIIVDMLLSVINLAILVLILASPNFPRTFQREPYYGI